jgi:hypothetical protein
MMQTPKSKFVKDFLENTPEDGTIDRFRSEALQALKWAEEIMSTVPDLNQKVDKIAAGFTTNTGIRVPEYVKPPNPLKTPVKAATVKAKPKTAGSSTKPKKGSTNGRHFL